MKNINIILKGTKSAKHGYLKLSVRQYGKTLIHSLGIKVLKKDWNVRTQRVRASARLKDLDGRTSEQVNTILEKKLRQYANSPIPSGNIRCICHFILIVINQTTVIGTKEKYQNVLNLFKDFIQKAYGKEDLEFEKIDSDVIINFFNYLRTPRLIGKRLWKANNVNTANGKIKTLKSFFTKLEKRGIYSYEVSPFSTIKLKYQSTKKDYLTIDELNRFIKLAPKDRRTDSARSPILYQLEDIKDCFIFSAISQGLRISDILTLRMNDILVERVKDVSSINQFRMRIEKRMFKTKKVVIVNFTTESLIYLEKSIKKLVDRHCPEYYENSDYIAYSNYVEYRKKVFKRVEKSFKELNTLYTKDSDTLKSKREELEKELNNLNDNYYHYAGTMFLELIGNNKTFTKFLFPFLNNDNFQDIDDGNDFSLINKKQHLELIGKRGYINRLLKDLFMQAKINKPKLSFHSARHTYTTLILDNIDVPVSLYDVQKSLGHDSVISTEKYIESFNNKHLIKINEGLHSRLKLIDI